ncbi:uncharacterized protein LOC130053218 isoform X2 [Ostrea edulis]|uniref:uncharacterized protein LOC130053218 isoform X2 n=1 Tax=Ostrea edulis TaxID=37623 RepID=UPI0024AFCEE3|nr:uncharacterized protein LOC130053218 isoform X2 [Ostrea edulis]
MEFLLAPSDIYFSQDSISNRFGVSTRHYNKSIGETLDDILRGQCSINDIPTISVVSKRNVWVTADNRRLWIFKKLQTLGKCEKITVKATSYINPKKCCVQPNIRVRGYEGGYLWRSWASETHVGTRLMEQMQDTTRCTQTVSREVQASLHSFSLSGIDVPGFQTVAQFSVQNSARSYHSIHNENKSFKYSAATFSKLDDPENDICHQDKQTGTRADSRNDMVYERPAHHTSPRQQARLNDMDTVYTSEMFTLTHPRYTIPDSNHLCKESSITNEALPNTSYVDDREKIVHLKPLDVGFADDPLLTPYDGESLGKQLDELCTQYPTMTLPGHEYSLNVFKYQEKYYSTDSSTLWILQVLERFTGNARITGTLVPRPPHVSISNGLHNSFRSINRINGGKWKSIITLNRLPQKGREIYCFLIYFTQQRLYQIHSKDCPLLGDLLKYSQPDLRIMSLM